MNNKIIFFLTFLFFIFSHSVIYARSGCCSHHGGVCGCGCCDGTSLSSTCAPYYPSCSSTKSYVAPTYKPTSKPTPKPTVYIPAPTPKTQSSPVVKSSLSDDSYDKDSGDSTGILEWGFWGFVIYYGYKWWKSRSGEKKDETKK